MTATTEGRYAGMVAHMDRMSRYAEVIARQLGATARRARMVRAATKLHDAGKIAIPDRILLKPGPLTPGERSVIELHTVIGHELLRDSSSELLDVAAVVALSHHERWDGAGYPHALGEDEIPLVARIATVADVFDSLTRDRPYRRAVEPAQALEFVQAGRGTQFDPDVVDAFLAAQAEIRCIRGIARTPGPAELRMRSPTTPLRTRTRRNR